jgi:hypothetical protein
MCPLPTAYGQLLRDSGIGFISLASGVHNQALLTALKHVGEAAEAVGKDEIERVRATARERERRD